MADDGITSLLHLRSLIHDYANPRGSSLPEEIIFASSRVPRPDGLALVAEFRDLDLCGWRQPYPYWRLYQQSGTVTLSREQSYSGSQSLKFASAPGGPRRVSISHGFGDRFSTSNRERLLCPENKKQHRLETFQALRKGCVQNLA